MLDSQWAQLSGLELVLLCKATRWGLAGVKGLGVVSMKQATYLTFAESRCH